ncbi:MAG: SDR family NAD(P)-dependent oxidoreductase [Parvularculaceae bacterium]|nr:SDR family NAD(P)-dependent oxidoreductase [Parvularculaceae bacterium]
MAHAFKDKLCVVTGAGSGIGRAVAINLARQGAALALSDINEAGLEETKRLIGAPPSNRIRFDRLDVADAAAIERYAASVKESLGDADYVFNIAGLTRVGRFDETPLSSFEKIIDVNFWGVVRMSKAFLPQLVATKGGLVNISSLFGLIGYPNQAHYCASKFAVRGFSETLAIEMEEKGVRVTSVHPGGVATAIARNAAVDKLPADVADRKDFEANFDKAAITSPERAAEIILDGAARGKRRVLVGRDAKLVSFIQRLLPQSYPKALGAFIAKLGNGTKTAGV